MAYTHRKTFRSFVKYLAARSSEIASPILSARLWGIPSPTSPQGWRKGLLLGANHIGDMLYRSSSLEQLRAGLPDCEWHIIAPEPAAQVLIGNPAISKVHRFEVPTACHSLEFQILKSENYDVAICYDAGMYLPPLKLAVDLRIPNRVGYTHKGFSAWVTHPVSMRYPQAYPAYFRDLVLDLTSTANASCLRPVVYPSVPDEAAAAAFADAKGISRAQAVVACFVTTRQPSGVWPSDRYAATVATLENQCPDVATILMGGPGDEPVLAELKTRFRLRANVAAGELPLLALVCFLRRCQAVLTTDSGPRHLTNAAGTTPVFFRNISFHPAEAGCYLENEIDIAPAGLGPVLPSEQRRVFDAVSPEMAAEAVWRVLPD